MFVILYTEETTRSKRRVETVDEHRAVARFLLVGGQAGQYKFINRNFSEESRKIVLLIFKPFKMSKKQFILA